MPVVVLMLKNTAIFAVCVKSVITRTTARIAICRFPAMTDRKSLAAGDEGGDEPPIKAGKLEPAFGQEKLDRGRIVKCERCNTEKAFFDRCPGCQEFNKKTCVCGHLAAIHSVGLGARTRKRMWVCTACLSGSSERGLEFQPVCMNFVERGNY